MLTPISELIMAQAAHPAAARYFATQRLFGGLFLILLVLGIVYMIKKISK